MYSYFLKEDNHLFITFSCKNIKRVTKRRAFLPLTLFWHKMYLKNWFQTKLTKFYGRIVNFLLSLCMYFIVNEQFFCNKMALLNEVNILVRPWMTTRQANTHLTKLLPQNFWFKNLLFITIMHIINVLYTNISKCWWFLTFEIFRNSKIILISFVVFVGKA